MKKQLSQQTKRSRPVSSKVQTNRLPTKVGSRKGTGSTARANKANDVRRASLIKSRSGKRVKPRLNENSGLANKDHAPSIDRAASKEASLARPDPRNQDLMRHEKAIGPMESPNGASEPDPSNRSFNRTWLDWSNATLAANLRTTEELMRCKSPIDLWAISSRIALRSWVNLWPLTRRPA
jgi:hypothetical protein